jgi:hypothetical protein
VGNRVLLESSVVDDNHFALPEPLADVKPLLASTKAVTDAIAGANPAPIHGTSNPIPVVQVSGNSVDRPSHALVPSILKTSSAGSLELWDGVGSEEMSLALQVCGREVGVCVGETFSSWHVCVCVCPRTTPTTR